MLRKTYQIMQKTRGLVSGAGEQLWRMGETSFKRNALGHAVTLSTCPDDLWTGDPARGADLARFALQSQNEFLCRLFSPEGSADLDPAFHNFSWLLDLRANGTPEARRASAKLTHLWMSGNDSPILGSTFDVATAYHRLRRVIGAYAFFEPSLSPEERSKITAGLLHHLPSLKRTLHVGAIPLEMLYAAGGMLTIGFSTGMPGNEIAHLLRYVERAVQTLVLVDGGPVTRRPSDLPDLLRILVELRHTFTTLSVPMPSFLPHAIDRMVPAIRALRLGNGCMATFHGGNVGNPALIDDILEHADNHGATALTLPYTGFERLATGAQAIVMDTGRAALATGHHASTSAFEWSCDDHVVVVNCGKHATDPLWQDLLAATSAHSTVTLGHQDNVPVGALADVDIFREDLPRGTMIEVIHNGYQTRNGFIHARKLTLPADGKSFSGVDTLHTAVPPLTPVDYTVRFHLHPLVSAVVVHPGPKVRPCITLTLPNGVSWKFEDTGDRLTLEDSVYLAETGKPVKTRQIVISGEIPTAKKSIAWKFTRL